MARGFGAASMLLFALSAVACHRSSTVAGRTDGGTEETGNPVEARASLLGGERGLDHVGIAVKDLDAATHTYEDVLGFSRPQPGKLPNGIRNVNYYFADATYLETLVYWDRSKAAWLANFTDKHSGALFGVLSAYSPEATSEYLAKRGIVMGKVFSGTIQTGDEDAMPQEKWKTFFLPNGFLAGDPFYFISYTRGPRDAYLQQLRDPKARRLFLHRNTALGLRAVWLAVPNLVEAAKAYDALGMPRGNAFTDPALDAEGQVFVAGAGEIWLLAPRSPSGGVVDFLRERGGPGILGVTLLAGSVPRAAQVIGEHLGTSLPTYAGLHGTSIRVPPEVTLGVWIEFAPK
jgi:catechol 2,3-dioxygenase-like lactoylglutathione lyase family enzyme